MSIEIWSDIACPWCYIGKRRFEAALNAFSNRDSVEVTWRSYQLDPSLPAHYEGTEAEYLSSRKGIPAAQLAPMFRHVTEQAAGEGLSYDFDRIVVANSFTAHRLLHLAKAHGRADEVKEALLSAHFKQGRNIGDLETLVDIATGAGLDAAEVRAVLAADTYGEDVRRDIAEASALGISGVPFFVIDRKYGISGAQPVDVFLAALEQAWQEANPLTMVAAGDGAVCGPEGCS